MKPAPQDLALVQGDSFDLFFRLKKLTAPATYTYVDLTGATVKSQIRQTPAASQVDADFVVTPSNQTTTPGGVLLHLTSVVTAGMTLTDKVWDCQVTFANGDVRTVLSGKVTIAPDVTRP